MTYNVLVATGGDGGDAWDRRVDGVAGTIRVDAPGLVGLQEVRAEQLEDLRERLPEYEWVGVGRKGGDEGEFCPVGARTDRFAVLSSETFWLSETPDAVGSVDWGASFPRIVTQVVVRDEATGRRLQFANTHLDHESARARREGAALVRHRLLDDQDGVPTVVTGDLNCEPGSDPYCIVAGTATDARGPKFRDTRDAAARPIHGPKITFPGFSDPSTGRTIDHVFVSDAFDVIQHATRADTRGDGRFPSDHLPVLADLELDPEDE